MDSKRGDYFCLLSNEKVLDQLEPGIMTPQEIIDCAHQGALIISPTSVILEDITVLTPPKSLAEHLIDFCMYHTTAFPDSTMFQDLAPCYIRNPEFTKKKVVV